MSGATLGASVARPVAASGSGAIVPLRGLWVIGAVLVCLVVAIATDQLWPLVFFHVAAGALWTSIDLFMGFVIGPIMSRLDPPARVAVTRRLMPQMLMIMPTLVLVTLASGWQLARRLDFLAVPYPQHWWIVASFIVVAVMAITAYAVLEPANIVVLLELRKPEPNVALIGRLMRRFIYAAGVTGLMQVAILVIMTQIATW
ncbi:MAG: hypothetical protein KGK34_13505 [Chloroflexota bacterium]|nr:hypothetical protein [Chloroflexota bacterium]